jgi:AcrR family transcriptional regulator
MNARVSTSQLNPSPAPLAKGDKTRETILDTALKIVSRHGLEGLTIGELAKVVGMSKSGLFAHFGGKDELQLRVLELATTNFVDQVMRPAFTAPRGQERIRALFKNWLQHLNDKAMLPGGSVLIAASIELDDRPGRLRDYVQNAQKDLISNIEKAARIAIEEKDFRNDLDVEQFAWTLYSFVLGYHHFKRLLDDPKAEIHLKRSFNGLMDISQPKRSASKTKSKKKK